MRNIKLALEYEGTNYYGFQRQPNLPTIQGELERALMTLVKEKVTIVGAARTDAGVHATHQVANFLTSSQIPLPRLFRSLNALLPKDIVVSQAQEKELSFHARRQATSREYKYYILNRKHPSVFFQKISHFIAPPLDIKRMKKGISYLKGRQDFSSFCPPSERKAPLRTIFEFNCLPAEPVLRKAGLQNQNFTSGLICFTVKADSFLTHMVRIMMGTLVEVGLGKLPEEKVKKILLSKDRRKAGPTLPAKGLILSQVNYT